MIAAPLFCSAIEGARIPCVRTRKWLAYLKKHWCEENTLPAVSRRLLAQMRVMCVQQVRDSSGSPSSKICVTAGKLSGRSIVLTQEMR